MKSKHPQSLLCSHVEDFFCTFLTHNCRHRRHSAARGKKKKITVFISVQSLSVLKPCTMPNCTQVAAAAVAVIFNTTADLNRMLSFQVQATLNRIRASKDMLSSLQSHDSLEQVRNETRSKLSEQTAQKMAEKMSSYDDFSDLSSSEKKSVRKTLKVKYSLAAV